LFDKIEVKNDPSEYEKTLSEILQAMTTEQHNLADNTAKVSLKHVMNTKKAPV
jgi:hypothetical protein